jgi:uncharacterized membrane protein
VALLAAAGAGLYNAVALWRHATYQSGIDLALYGQAVRHYAAGEAPWSSLKAQAPFNLWGDHFTPLVALLGPFYRLWPDVRLLLVAQSLLLGAAVLIVGWRLVGRTSPALGVSAAAVLAASWGLANAARFDFHEIAFAVPLIALAVMAAQDGAWWRLGALSCALWLVKEDMTLLTAGLALYLWATRRRRAALILGAASCLAGAVIVGLVIPGLSQSGRYTYWGQLGGPSTLAVIAANLASPQVWLCLAVIAATLGLGALSPIAWVIVPTLAARLVTATPALFALSHHYNAVLMPVCLLAAADAWRRLQTGHADQADSGRADRPADPGAGGPNRLDRPAASHTGRPTRTTTGRPTRTVTATKALQVVLWVGTAVFGLARLADATLAGGPACADNRCLALDQAVASIPADAKVAADVFVAPHLVDRAEPYLAVPGWTDSTGRPLRDITWLIADTSDYRTDHPPGWEARLTAELLRQGYHQRSAAGTVVVLSD